MIFLLSVSWCYTDKNRHARGATSTLAFAIAERYSFFSDHSQRYLGNAAYRRGICVFCM